MVRRMKQRKNQNKVHRHNLYRALLTAAVSVWILLSLSACSSGGIPEFKNSDFSSGSGSSIEGWIKYDYAKDSGGNSTSTDISLTDIGFSGQCVKIENKVKNDARIYQKIKVQPKSNYCIQFDLKYENIDEGVEEASRGAGLNVSTIGGTGRSGSFYGSNSEWQTASVYFSTQSGQKNIELSIGIGSYSAESKGTAYIDNVRIEKIESIPSGEYAFSAAEAASANSGTGASGASVWLKLFFLAAAGGTLAFVIRVSIKADKENAANGNPLSQKNPILNKKDFIILLVMVVACSGMSFFKLGNTYAASSYWKAAESGESVIIEFDEVSTVARTVYSNNIPVSNSSYSVSYEKEDGSGEYVNLCTIKEGAFFEWERVDNTFTTKRVKVVSNSPGLGVNEMGFFKKNDNGEFERLNLKVVETNYNKDLNEAHNPSMLFDEQDTVEPYSSYMSTTYFDEIYFPRTAYEQINGYSIYEVTHPPMGKILMSVGIELFGMNPFGWRFMGTLFGVALVPLMYLLALKIFKKRLYAFTAAFLMMFDFMRLTQTRLATIDSYSAFFILCMYYFMYDYFTQKSYEKKKFWKSLVPLLLSGIMFGLGASTKWVCVYTGVGLAILFFLAKYLEADDYALGRVKMKGNKTWFSNNFLPTCCACLLFFIVIPGVIYVLSYIPYLASNPDKSLLDIVLDNQKYMFNYHSGLTEGHPYGSPWYTWPVDYRPIYYYSGRYANIGEGMATSIVSMGNPLIWWSGLACIFPAAYYAWKKRDKGMMVVFVGFAVQYFPWILVTRVAFIYHYFTAIPFVMLMIVYVIKNLIEDHVINKTVLWVYLGLVLLLFILFYPVLTGREVSRSYVNCLRWFSTWSF